MSDKIFNTRISLKYDTLANWNDKNPQLRVGEVAVVVVPAASGVVAQEPAILFKVGDGAKLFKELPFTSAIAGDVYDWAKAATKPTYSADEITGLADYISGKVQDTNTTYKLQVDADNARKFYLYSQELGSADWTLVSTVEIPAETVYTLVEGTANGTVKFNGVDVAVHGLGSAAYEDADAFEAKGALDNAIAEAKKAGTDAQAAVDALGALVGELPEDATADTVVGYVDEKIAAIPAQTDYTVEVVASNAEGVAKRYNIKQAATGLDMNIDIPKDMVVESGSVETKGEAGEWGEAGTYLHLILANAAEDDIYINVGDLIEYVTSGSVAGDQIMIAIDGDHKVTATLSDGSVTLAQLDASVQAEIGKAHEHANKTELDKIEVGDKAKWDAAEAKAHEHENKDVLDGVTAEKVASWDSKAEGDHKHDIEELEQASGYIIFDCGSASVNI